MAKANVAAAEANLNQVEISRRAILRGLELLLGRYPRGELETTKTFVALPPPIPVGLPSALLERRPDIIAAEQRLAAAFYGVQVAEAARLPRISLTAAGGVVDSGLADLVGITSPVAQLGANMFAPLYNGGALQAGVDIADAQQRATMALYAQKALEAFSEVEGALTNEPLLKNREERLQSALEQSEEAYARTRRQYEVGRVELLALLQTQASLISAKSALIAVKNERLAQRVDLHLALGGSFQ
jgi:outer membrane protein TolC